MKSAFHKLTALLIVMLLAGWQTVCGQDTSIEMADTMRSNGKIYVVVAVAAVVMAGILLYLVMMDRKISAIEKRLKNKN
jgi:CcmD family protein